MKSPEAAASRQGAPATIMVVDDSPETLGFLTEVLERAGFTVLVALRGERALEAIAQMRPDLVLMDALMPDMDGFETCRRLKRMPGTDTLPVIFMTGLTETASVIRGLQAGGCDFVAKPVVTEELVARIEVHLEAARLVASAFAAMEAAGYALFAATPDLKLRWATPAARRMLAASDEPGADRIPAALAGLLDAAVPLGETQMLQLRSAQLGAQARVSLVGRLGANETLLRIVEQSDTPEERRLRDRLPVTPREAEVLLWLAHGKSNRDIAEILGLKTRTVNKHLEQVYAKLGVENRATAVARTLQALSAP